MRQLPYHASCVSKMSAWSRSPYAHAVPLLAQCTQAQRYSCRVQLSWTRRALVVTAACWPSDSLSKQLAICRTLITFTAMLRQNSLRLMIQVQSTCGQLWWQRGPCLCAIPALTQLCSRKIDCSKKICVWAAAARGRWSRDGTCDF